VRRAITLCAILLTGFGGLQAQDLSALATEFLNSLGTLKSKAQFKLDDIERFNWNFVPVVRKGPTFQDFSDNQKVAVLALLKASLSSQGYQKANSIMAHENILRELEGRSTTDTHRDPLNYHFTFFGNPNDKEWCWRFEGHHLSLSFAISNNQIVSATPSFFGSNPGIVPTGPERGKQILKLETDLGFSLIQSMDETQLKTALFSRTALPEIVTGNDRKARSLTPEGIRYSALNENQKQIFLQLLDVYVRNYEFGFSKSMMDKIRAAGLDNLSFGWAGSLSPGAGHYYRIQGPMLLIEYDNTQNNANHVHTAVRDLTNDFAEDILREHYKNDHAH
jgi:hypothetical protein